MKFGKNVRYSAISTFIVGIIAVIQGCTVREGALLLLVLLGIQMCGLPLNEQIVYECQIDGVTQICLINFDGTGFFQLTNTANDNDDPSINLRGQIVFGCGDFPTVNICVIDADGSNFRQLTSNGGHSNPRINNQGQVVWECANATKICALGDRGVGVRILYQDPFVEANLPAINNLGQVVYSCLDGGGSELCLISYDGSDFRRFTAKSDGIASFEPEINDAGHIVSECNTPSGPESMCMYNEDGSILVRISNAGGTEEDDPRINDRDEVVWECGGGANGDDLCGVKFGLKNFTVLDNTQDREKVPSINSGSQIAYECRINSTTQICVINFDGSDRRQITNGPGAKGRPDIN